MGRTTQMDIKDSDRPLPDEEDIYGVNDIDEYDPDYWMPAELKRYRKQLVIRWIAAVLAVSFALAAIFYFR